MSRYGMLSDDYYVNMNLNTEMELPQTRDGVLHFFEQMKKKYPSMRNFYGRERGEFVLEEDKEPGSYRWVAVEGRRISSGYVNPPSWEDAIDQHSTVLTQAPYSISVSPLDCESLNEMMGFDFTYRGNHNELLMEALGVCPAFEKLTEMEGATVVGNEPAIQIALDEDCRIQCRLSIETRTSAYHVRTREFPEEQISVYLTARRYGSLDVGESFESAMMGLGDTCRRIVDEHVLEQILRPLQHAIAIK